MSLKEEIVIEHHLSEKEMIEKAKEKFGFIPGLQFRTGRHGELIMEYDERDTTFDQRANLRGLMDDLKDDEEWVTDVHF